MDMDDEMARAKWMFITGALFLVSCFICYGELVYLLFGHEVSATVTQAYEEAQHGRFGQRTGTNLTIEYVFIEPDGTRRTGSDTVGLDFPLPPDGTIAVQYTAGAEGRSRLAGHHNWVGIVIFVVCLVVFAIVVYSLLREANEEFRPKKHKRIR